MKLRISYLMLLTSVLLFACNNSSKDNSENKDGKEYTSAYICPMHCEGSGSDEPGTCPVCGMDYVPNPDHQKKEEAHPEEMHDDHMHMDEVTEYRCRMHPEITGENGESCSICGMPLEVPEPIEETPAEME